MAGDGDLDVRALREHLSASRHRGLPFEEAWRAACAALLPEGSDRASGRVLAATREAWRSAYEFRPPRRDHMALDTLADTLDDSAHAEFGRSALLG